MNSIKLAVYFFFTFVISSNLYAKSECAEIFSNQNAFYNKEVSVLSILEQFTFNQDQFPKVLSKEELKSEVANFFEIGAESKTNDSPNFVKLKGTVGASIKSLDYLIQSFRYEHLDMRIMKLLQEGTKVPIGLYSEFDQLFNLDRIVKIILVSEKTIQFEILISEYEPIIAEIPRNQIKIHQNELELQQIEELISLLEAQRDRLKDTKFLEF